MIATLLKELYERECNVDQMTTPLTQPPLSFVQNVQQAAQLTFPERIDA